MKVKISSLFFLLFSSVTDALLFSKEELKNIQSFSRTFFESVRNGTICVPFQTIRNHSDRKKIRTKPIKYDTIR